MRDSKNLRFLAVVAEMGSARSYIVGRRSGLSMRDCNRIASRLIEKGRLSRIKPKLSEGGGCYRYYLNDTQLEAYYRLAGKGPGIGLEGVDAVGVVDRLKFLRTLKERTVYKASPVLSAIIGDYERTLSTAREAEI